MFIFHTNINTNTAINTNIAINTNHFQKEKQSQFKEKKLSGRKTHLFIILYFLNTSCYLIENNLFTIYYLLFTK